MEKANNVSDKGSSLTEKIKDLLPIEIQGFVTGDDILNLINSDEPALNLTSLISDLNVNVNNIQELCQKIENAIAEQKQPKPINKTGQVMNLLNKELDKSGCTGLVLVENIEKAAHKLLRCNMSSLKNEINLFIKNSNEEIKRLTGDDLSITLIANVDELFTSIKEIQEQKEEIKDTIFSDNALKDIHEYLLVESKSHKTNDLVNFSGGNVKNSEVTDNRYSRFSLQQINLMLSNGVSPSCLHDINDFDTFIKFDRLTEDIDKRSISDLHPSFIEFLYIESNSNGEHLSKAFTVDQLTKDFVQKLISKYIKDIKDRSLSSVEKIDDNPIIKSLFFKGGGILRDKKEINELLGPDEEIFEMLMKAKVSWMLILDIINNYHIDLQLSEDWLSKLGNKQGFEEYDFLADTVKQKKLKTFRLEDLLGNKNQKVNDLLAGKEVKKDECTLKLTDEQIELAKAIKIIAGDLQTIKEYFWQNKDNKENNTKEDKLKKLFNHQFWYDDLLNQIFFTSLVTFFKEEIFLDLSDQIDNAGNTKDWQMIFEHKAISHFFKNLKSDFTMSILLRRFLESYFFPNVNFDGFAEFLIVLFDSVKEAEHQNENQNQENNIEKKMENNENNNVATNISKSNQLSLKDMATIYTSLHERNKNHNNLSENKIEQNIIDNKEPKITNEEQNNQKDEKDKIAIKRVFIKTFVAKAKDINRPLIHGGDTLLSYIFDNLNNINQSFKSKGKEYEFNEDDRNYFIACCNVLIIRHNLYHLKIIHR